MKYDMLNKLKKSDLLKNGSLSMIGSILIRAVDLISIPIFTRILDTATYGRVSVFTTYTQIFMVILGLDFNGCVSRATLEYKERKQQFYSVTLFFSMMWTLLVIILFNTFHNLTENLLAMSQMEMNIMLIYSFCYFVILYKSAELIFTFQYKRNIAMSILMALGNLCLSVVLVLGFFSGDRFLGKILGSSIPTVIIASAVFIRFMYRGKEIWNREYVTYAVKFSVPLIPHNLSHLILSNADRIMIQNMVNNSASGIYALAHNIGVMMQVFTEGANNAWTPMLFRKLEANKRKQIRKEARIYLLGYSMMAIGVIAISPEILKIFAGKDFWEGINFVMWLCLATYYIFVYQLYVNVEFYHKKTALISLGTLMAAILNIILNFYGIPRFGYAFAAISTAVSYGGLVFFHYIILNYIIKDRVIDNMFTIITAIAMVPATYLIYLCRENVIYRIALLVIYESVMIFIMIYMVKRMRESISE